MTRNTVEKHAEPLRSAPKTFPTPVWLLMLGFGILSAIYSITIPIFEISDELWHYPMVEIIARTWRLPVQPLEPGRSSGPWRQEGSQPPLYYALGAALTRWVDTSDLTEVRQPNPHVRAGEATPDRDNVNLVIHNAERERFPWRGTVLAVHVVRFLSVVLGVWSVWLTWRLLHELSPSHPWLAYSAAAAQAFTPMHLFIHSSVNNDNLIIPLSTLALFLMVRRIKSTDQAQAGHPWSLYAPLGIVLGCALLTKASGIALVPLAVATVLWDAYQLQRRTSWHRAAIYAAQAVAAVLLPALLISGWWFVRNYRLYGDWLGLNAFYAVLGTRDVSASLGQLWAERKAFAAGYWGNFGGLNVPMPDVVYRVLNIIAIIAGAGLVLRFVCWSLRPRPNDKPTWRAIMRLWPFNWDNLTTARALACVWPTAVLVSWVRWATVTWSSQGRLIFSAIPLWSAGLIWGVTAWWPRRFSRAVRTTGLLMSCGLFVLTSLALPLWILPAYAPPTPLSARTNVPKLEPLDVTFEDLLSVQGYLITPQQVRPGDYLQIDLIFEAKQPSTTYHSLAIHVLGVGDRIIAQRDTFPGHGLLPTTQLTPGHRWHEQHLIQIPTTALTPDTLTLALGVYETASGKRLPPTGALQEIVEDMARFGSVGLTPRPETDPGLGLRFGEGMVLRDYNVSSVVVQPGSQITVELEWACSTPMDIDYTVSVQLIDSQWRKAAQSDAWPANGSKPTSTWKPGTQFTETRTLTVNADALPGLYNLRVAVYSVAEDGTLVHLPVYRQAGDMPTKAIELTSVRVSEP